MLRHPMLRYWNALVDLQISVLEPSDPHVTWSNCRADSAHGCDVHCEQELRRFFQTFRSTSCIKTRDGH
jgi:hypothetical protein